MCETYILLYSCTHTETGQALPCRPVLTRLIRGEDPVPDDCENADPTQEETLRKCDDCHRDWEAAQDTAFDTLWDVLLMGLARGHEDLEEWLREERDRQRGIYRARLCRWEWVTRDAHGKTVYETYPGAIWEQLTAIAELLGEEVMAREQKVVVEGLEDDEEEGGEDEEFKEEEEKYVRRTN